MRKWIPVDESIMEEYFKSRNESNQFSFRFSDTTLAAGATTDIKSPFIALHLSLSYKCIVIHYRSRAVRAFERTKRVACTSRAIAPWCTEFR